MNALSLQPRTQRRLALTVWVLLVATIVPVCEAQGFWAMAILAGGLSLLGIWLCLRADRPVLSQRISTAIALALGGIAALVSLDSGTIGVFAVANWLVAIGILKCWQLGTSRDYAHVLIIVGLLLLVGSLVSWQLGFAVALGMVLVLGPSAMIGWHLMTEQERQTRLLAGPAGPALTPTSAAVQREQRLSLIGITASIFCSIVAFLIFATFPRLRTPLRPVARGSPQQVMGFSAETRLDDIGRLQTSNRVVMRAQLRMAGQPLGSQSLEPYFRGMTYNHYAGPSWENISTISLVPVRLTDDADLVRFRTIARPDMPGAVEQEYWVEAGPLPCLVALQTPIALGSQEIQRIQWRQEDDVLLPDTRLPTVMHYTALSVPPYLLTTPALASSPATSVATDQAPATAPATQLAPPVFPPRVGPDVVSLAISLAGEVTDQVDRPPPDLYESIVGCFMRYLQGPQFTYSLDPPPRVRGISPLEQFLLVKRGYCEYYATALAVFCQSLNIPARYVTGFRGGKYNDVGGFYAVRDSDAHSWVEVWLPDRGWTTFDPTPSREAPRPTISLQSTLAGLLDYLQFQWSNWVVAYDVLHRQSLFGTIGDWMSASQRGNEKSWIRFLWMFRELLAGPETLSPLGKMLYWLGLLGVLSLSGYVMVQVLQHGLRWWRLRRHMRAARRTGVRFYERVLAALAQRHLVRRETETPREFARRVEQTLPYMGGSLQDLIERYYAVRYGRQDQMHLGDQAAQDVLRRLARSAPQQEVQA